jgi:UDPglucose 6-dehydrogenase
MRDAPSIALIRALQDMGVRIRAYDPVGIEQAKLVLEDVTYCESAYAAAEGADVLTIVTEWEEFRALDFGRLRRAMRNPALVDLRNIYLPEEVAREGFAYFSIGRADVAAASEARETAQVRKLR